MKTVSLKTIKEQYPIFALAPQVKEGKGLIYLDSAATAQKPKVVLDALQQYYTTMNANVHRGLYDLSEAATIAYDQARETVARFINAQFPEELIFSSGTTASLNMLARMLEERVQEGDEIVLSMLEHHSNLVPWQELAKRKGAVLHFIPLTKDFQVDMQAAAELITAKTTIVAVSHCSNVLGTVVPIKELSILAHKHDAILVVDAAQSVAHHKVDVQDLDCDFLAFSAHKIGGPTGIGALYGKRKLLESLKPVVFGGGMIQEVTCEETSYGEIPERFEAGTPQIAQAISFAAAVKFIEQIGFENIEKHLDHLNEYALKKLQEIEGLTIIGPLDARHRAPVFSFTLKGVHPHDIAELLNRKGIAVRAGNHCAMPLMKELGIHGTTRASLYLYNSIEEIDALCQGLRYVKEVFNNA